jgi:mannose-1-phosphate guanylyltransferase/mannose-6-phosphate isomerase
MCGGAGVRLWPASRAARPKQFIPLIGERSLFQETALRVASIEGAADLVVVAGVAHAAALKEQLAAINLSATILLEPEPRDSAAAIAAACAWIEAHDKDGVAIVVASDHHVPDASAFRAAAAAAARAAEEGFIVTMGVTPTGPNTAYGYVDPGAAQGEVRKVNAFVEKPKADTAQSYIAKGYLWNSGNFVARASVMLGELERYAPDVAAAARAGVAEATESESVQTLGDGFRAAPKISIDYAVMEKTDRAAVIPVNFAWSDLGAWDAVWSASAKDGDGNAVTGAVTHQGSHNTLIHAAPGVHVAAVGVRNLAIVADGGHVLVADLAQSQSVKTLVDGLKAKGAEAEAAPFNDIAGAKTWFGRWLRMSALPLWASLGADHARGGYHEALSADGAGVDLPRRMRVQARQAYTYAQAGLMGWPGPWRQAAQHALDYLDAAYLRSDGLYRTLVAPDGDALKDDALIYDQAFALLALASLFEHDRNEAYRRKAEAIIAALQSYRHAAAGFREVSAHPFQANAHMHLFEAALAWREAEGGEVWEKLAAELLELARTRFYDRDGGFIREFYAADWSPAPGQDGRRIEPGHQFEWAWLLARAGETSIAQQLFASGVRGLDPRRGAAIEAVDDAFKPISQNARLWAQTEYLKAALILGEQDHALAAAKILARYLSGPAPGLWYDQLRTDNSFVTEPVTGSSFYHIITAIRVLETS